MNKFTVYCFKSATL